MLSVHISVTFITVYYFYKVLFTKPKSEDDEA